MLASSSLPGCGLRYAMAAALDTTARSDTRAIHESQQSGRGIVPEAAEREGTQISVHIDDHGFALRPRMPAILPP